MTREELRDYVEEQRGLNMIPYHVYSTLIDGIDELEQESCEECISRKGARMKHSELYKIASPKPCPFCGWGTIVDGSYLTGHSCACMSCGARTRRVKTWEEAVRLWNVREYENKAESEEQA